MREEPNIPVFLRGKEIDYRSGLTRLADRHPFRVVVDELVERGFELYLTGEMVRTALGGKPKRYAQIDLIANGGETELADLKEAFRESSCRKLKTVFDRAEIGRSVPVSYDIIERMGGIPPMRYLLKPHVPYGARPALAIRKPSDIMLHLVSGNGQSE